MAQARRRAGQQPQASANWKILSGTLHKNSPEAWVNRVKQMRQAMAARADVQAADASNRLLEILLDGAQTTSPVKIQEVGKYVAIDCEMVGVGPQGCKSVLARVSLVNFYGTVILDTFVRPKERVTDYRTWVSGVTAADLENAEDLHVVVSKVANLIKGRVLIGHAVFNDLRALLLSHPKSMIRDTSTYPPLKRITQTKTAGLKNLASLLLNVRIQGGAHSSVEDARATMAIYRTQKQQWESSLTSEFTVA